MKMKITTSMKNIILLPEKKLIELMNLVKKDIIKQTKNGFDANGTPFAPYKTNSFRGTIRKGQTSLPVNTVINGKVYGPGVPVTLVNTGQMLKSLRVRMKVKKVSLVLEGPRIFIGLLHQNGTRKMAARPWLGWRPSSRDIAKRFITKEMTKAIARPPLKRVTS